MTYGTVQKKVQEWLDLNDPNQRRLLERAGLCDSYLGLSHDLATGRAHVTTLPDAGNAIIVMQGANCALMPDAVARAVAGAKVVLVQLEISSATAEAALAAGRSAGATTILNAAPSRGITDTMLALADLVIVNDSEAADLGGVERLLESGPEAVIVTHGSRGATWKSRTGDSLFVPAVRIQAIDTTGAGDAFCGALAAGLSEGLAIETVMRRAAAAGAIVATQMGAQTEQLSVASVDQLLAAASDEGMYQSLDELTGMHC